MTKNNDKKVGRTGYDFFAEHPKLTLIISFVILLAIIALVWLRVPFKVAGIEVGQQPPAIIKDTTVEKQKPYPILPPKIVSQNPTFKPNKKKLGKRIEVKQGDTSIVVLNQPANINTGTNNGIIGNNNSVSVNVNEIKRKLREIDKPVLLDLIKEVMGSKPVLDSAVKVLHVAGSEEARNFAKEIIDFLIEKKFRIVSIGSFTREPPLIGVKVDFDTYKKCVSVEVGNR